MTQVRDFCRYCAPLIGAMLVLGCGGSTAAISSRSASEPAGAFLPSWSCVPLGPETCLDGRDNNCNGLADEGCGVTSGLVHITVAWNDDSADLDLEVVDPSGDIAEVGMVSAGGLTKDRDCPGRDQLCGSTNSENVILGDDRGPARGDYRVRVRLDALGTQHDEVRVSLFARLGPKTEAREFVLTPADRQRAFTWTL